MPQLNPAPWFITLIITWFVIFGLLQQMLALHDPTPPAKTPLTHHPDTWMWTWL